MLPDAARHQRGPRRRTVVLIVDLLLHRERRRLLADHPPRARARLPAHHPDRRRRHAGRRLDAQLLFGLGGGGHRLHARQPGADHHRRAGRLVRRDPLLHHVQGHEPLVLLRHPRRLRRRGAAAGGDEGSAGQAGLGRRRGLHHEERPQGHHRAGLRHGGRAGAARAPRDGRPAEEGGRRGQIRDPSGRGTHARAHERAAGRSQRSLRRGFRARGHQLRVLAGRRRLRHRRQRRHQPGGRGRQASPIYGMPILDCGRPGRSCSSSARWRRATPASTTRCSSATTR